MKILLPVDGSAFSDQAVHEVVTRPWPANSLFKVISAVRLPFQPSQETRSLPECDYSRIERAMMEHAAAIIDRTMAKLRSQHGNSAGIESAAIIGDAREVILEEAARWEADLIVLGSRGLGGFKRFLLGSVALGVLTHAPCTVRIVRGNAVQDGSSEMKILLAVDASLCSLAAAGEVALRPWPDGSRVKIIHAVDIPLSSSQVELTLSEAVQAQRDRAANHTIDKVRAQFSDHAEPRLKVESEILYGSPKEVILDEAVKWEADLIVLGSSGMGAVERFLLGSVSHAVASHAKCSVEIVRRHRPKNSDAA